MNITELFDLVINNTVYDVSSEDGIFKLEDYERGYYKFATTADTIKIVTSTTAIINPLIIGARIGELNYYLEEELDITYDEDYIEIVTKKDFDIKDKKFVLFCYLQII